MSLALETVCGKFGMKLTENPVTRVVALKIIELAQRGVHDAPTLTEIGAQGTQALFAVRLDTVQGGGKWRGAFTTC